MSQHAEKTALRRAVLAARDALPEERRATDAAALHHRLLALPELHAARRVLLYAARGSEVPLDGLAGPLVARGAAIGVPRVSGDDLLPCPTSGFDALVPGRFGIPTSLADPWEGAIDVVIAPGAAFDATGGRLGLGRGYYDRLLAGRAVGVTIGVCWDVQLVPRVPTEAHDRRVDLVVTPTSTIRI